MAFNLNRKAPEKRIIPNRKCDESASTSFHPQNVVQLPIPPDNFQIRASTSGNSNNNNTASSTGIKVVPYTKNLILSSEVLQQLRNANFLSQNTRVSPDVKENGNLMIQNSCTSANPVIRGSGTSDNGSDNGAVSNYGIVESFDGFDPAILENDEDPPIGNNALVETPPPFNDNGNWAECKEVLRTMLQQQTEILELCRSMNNPAHPTNNNILPDLPLRTLDDLLHFDEQLKNKAEFRQQFDNKIRKLGGKNLQKATAAAMSFLMTDEVAKKAAWTGVTENTLKISSTTFASIIIEILQSSYNSKKAETEDKIKDWLRRSGDRSKLAAKQRNKNQ